MLPCCSFRGAGAPLLRNVDWTRQAVISFHYNDFRDRSPFPDFADALREEPDGVLKCMGLSLCLVRADFEPDVPPHRITVRIQCVAPLTSLRDIKSSSVGKYGTRGGARGQAMEAADSTAPQ